MVKTFKQNLYSVKSINNLFLLWLVFSAVAQLLGKDVRPFARALNFGLNESELNNIVFHSQDENQAALKVQLFHISVY